MIVNIMGKTAKWKNCWREVVNWLQESYYYILVWANTVAVVSFMPVFCNAALGNSINTLNNQKYLRRADTNKKLIGGKWATEFSSENAKH